MGQFLMEFALKALIVIFKKGTHCWAHFQGPNYFGLN